MLPAALAPPRHLPSALAPRERFAAARSSSRLPKDLPSPSTGTMAEPMRQLDGVDQYPPNQSDEEQQQLGHVDELSRKSNKTEKRAKMLDKKKKRPKEKKITKLERERIRLEKELGTEQQIMREAKRKRECNSNQEGDSSQMPTKVRSPSVHLLRSPLGALARMASHKRAKINKIVPSPQSESQRTPCCTVTFPSPRVDPSPAISPLPTKPTRSHEMARVTTPLQSKHQGEMAGSSSSMGVLSFRTSKAACSHCGYLAKETYTGVKDDGIEKVVCGRCYPSHASKYTKLRRNNFLDGFLANMGVRCRNHALGCTAVFSPDGEKEHYRICAFAPGSNAYALCCYCPVSNCAHVCALQKISEHFQQDHQVGTKAIPYNKAQRVVLKSDKSWELLRGTDGSLFLLSMEPEGRNLAVSVVHVSMDTADQFYEYDMWIPGGRRISETMCSTNLSIQEYSTIRLERMYLVVVNENVRLLDINLSLKIKRR